MTKRWVYYVGVLLVSILLICIGIVWIREMLLWSTLTEDQQERARALAMTNFGPPENLSGSIFYGRFVDQHGDPVEGVKVMDTVRGSGGIDFIGWPWERWKREKYIFTAAKEKQFVCHSDQEGRFTIESDSDSSSIYFDGHSFHKDGYIGLIDARSRYSFHYDDPPDSSKPVIFHMWKRSANPPSRLIKRSYGYDIKANGKWHANVLITGEEVSIKDPRADLIFSSQIKQHGDDPDEFDWELTLEMLKGGIQAQPKEDMHLFLAPEDGYEKEIVLKGRFSDKQGNYHYQGGFYLRSYEGRVHASVYIEAEFRRKGPEWELRPTEDGHEYFRKDPEDGGHPYVEIYYSWLINPFGSRNLEYDPYRYEKLEKQRESGELKLSTEEFWKLVDDEDPVRAFGKKKLKAIVELLQKGETPKAKDYQ